MLAVACMVINLIAFFEWDTTYITNDGVQYLSTASNWLQGKGFSTNALMYSPHFQGEFPGPQTVWPPGYPLLLGLGGLLGLDLITTGLIINLISHALASLLVVLILRRMRVDTGFSIICGVLFYGMAIPWSFARGIITEPIFTCLILAAILALPDPDRSRLRNWLLCGLLVAGTIYVRYSAVIYAASMGAGIFSFLLFNNRGRLKEIFSGCLRLTALVMIPFLAFLQLMYRTNALTGTVERNAGTRVPETIYSVIRQWGAHSADMIGLSSGGLFSHEVSVFLFLLTVILVLSLIIHAGIVYRQDYMHDHLSPHATYSRVAGFVIVAHALLLFVYLSYCALTDSPLEILTRYLYQVYPGVFILFCALMFGLIQRVIDPQERKLPPLLKNSLIALTAIYVLGQVNEATSPQRFFAEGLDAHQTVRMPVSETESLNDFIDACFSDPNDGGAIWSTHGQHLHYNTRIPTLTLAEIYTNTPPNFETLEKQISTYGVKMFIFLDDDLNLNQEYAEHMGKIKKWLIANGHTSLPLLNHVVNYHATLDVFVVKGGC